MNDYEIRYVTDNGFEGTVILSAPNSAAAWEIFHEMGLGNIEKAAIRRLI